MKINVTKSTLPSFEEYVDEIRSIWQTHWLTNNGEKHNLFSRKLIDYLRVDNVVLYTNGHLALEAAIALFNFPKGSEIITTPFTFISTTNAIVRSGLVPIFCDINEQDYTIDITKIERLITEKTVAILPVHVYGNVCDFENIEKIAKKHDLRVIYDAAHAFGEKYKGRSIASFGDVSMFSFHATKVFNTIEGGALCFKNPKFVQTLNDMKNFGIRNEEESLFIGGNAKMSEFQAAMGLCNLRHIDENIGQRKKHFEKYIELLKNVKGIKLPAIQKNVESNYSYFPIVIDGFKYSRDDIKKRLAEHDIGARKYFYPLTNEFKCYENYDKGNTPIAKKISSNVLTIPLYPDLSDEDIELICNVIKGEK